MFTMICREIQIIRGGAFQVDHTGLFG